MVIQNNKIKKFMKLSGFWKDIAQKFCYGTKISIFGGGVNCGCGTLCQNTLVSIYVQDFSTDPPLILGFYRQGLESILISNKFLGLS